LGVQFQIGHLIALINLSKEEIVTTCMISRIGRQVCLHHGTPIEDGWFRVQLIEIVESKSFILLLVTNENDHPSQLILRDVMDSNLVWKCQFLQKNK
jgi:hypothetical protein